FLASPTFSIAPINKAEGSISQRRRPWTAERGKAWWLWCQDSPRKGSPNQNTFVERSLVSKRRLPKKWHTEFTLHVTWCTKKMRTRPPHRNAVSAPARVPVTAYP